MKVVLTYTMTREVEVEADNATEAKLKAVDEFLNGVTPDEPVNAPEDKFDALTGVRVIK